MVESSQAPSNGFKGEVTGLGLSDVIQLNVQNRFSGCISVQYDEGNGFIFFRDGAIIHAEQGEKLGEEAFYRILTWPAGQFSLQPNVATTRVTIQKGWQHLILEAHRMIDEQRAGRRDGPTAPGPESGPQDASPKRTDARAVLERVRRIPGVHYAVLQGKDGARVGDDSYEGETLAGQAAYLMLKANQLGSAFKAGDTQSAAVQGTTRHLLLLSAKSHCLSVLANADVQIGVLDAEVRKALVSGR